MTTKIGNLIPSMNSMRNVFTPSEIRIADIIEKNPSVVMYSVITELSHMANVGDTTVVRFCRKLGFNGYFDFRIAMTQEISMQSGRMTPVLEGVLNSSDDIGAIKQKLSQLNQKAIDETVSLLDDEQVRRVVDLLDEKTHIYFYGLGFSGFVAEEAKLKFLRLGSKTDAFTEGHMMSMNAALTCENDLVIGISHSGSSRDVVDAMEPARQAGASTVSITHHLISPITRHSDTVLLTGSNETALQSGTLSTRAAQIFVIDTLYSEYVRRNPDALEKAKNKTVKVLSEKMY